MHDDCILHACTYIASEDISNHNTISYESCDSSDINIGDNWSNDDMSLDCAHLHRDKEQTLITFIWK